MFDDNEFTDKVFALYPHQYEFFMDDTTPQLALIAGYGAGKTRAIVYKAIKQAFQNPESLGLIIEPTHKLARKILIPEFKKVCSEYNIDVTHRLTPEPGIVIHFDGFDSEIDFMSGDNPDRIIGITAAYSIIDEADMFDRDSVENIVKNLIGRNRFGNGDSNLQLSFASTPEGFGYLYDHFVKEPGNDPEIALDRRRIHAKSTDNWRLPQKFIDNMEKNYTPQQLVAYRDGQFANLFNHVVYYAYDKTENNSTLTINSSSTIHIGVDLNVNNMNAVIHVIDDKNKPHAVAELSAIKNTPELINTIKHLYKNKIVYIYPDASSRAEKSSGAKSDLIQFQQAFGQTHVIVRNANPLVRDRISNMNAMFLNGSGERNYFVNSSTCPDYVACLERQVYKKDIPDKLSGYDHKNDASGYFIVMRYPLAKRGSIRTY